jgi:hypothetical protein
VSSSRAGLATGSPVDGRSDGVVVVAGAAAGAASLALLHRRPLLLSAALAILAGALLARWRERRDLVGLAVGATFGNVTELVCDLGGVWIHATRQILGVAPVYIFVCYPILGLAFPRLTGALVGRLRRADEASGAGTAALVWAAHVALSYRYGTDNDAELVVSAVCLAAALARFHAPHDLVAAASGALLAMLWELPCVRLGAWRFPRPELFGMVPAWLPLAYGVFFVTLGRITAGLAARVERQE